MCKVLQNVVKAMESHIEEERWSTDPAKENYTKELSDCINELKFIRTQLDVRIGGKNTYCLQKANGKFFNYIACLVEI